MRYKEILQAAYRLTKLKPHYWLFGLVLFGGFNLYLINFFALITNGGWKSWPLSINAWVDSRILGYLAVILSIVALFVIFNVIKIIFVVVMHGNMHLEKSQTCDLCVKSDEQLLPYFVWIGKVMLASGITIGITAGLILLTNGIIASQGYDNPGAVVVNVIFITIVACIMGTWNLFTTYFVILHGLKFSDAASSAVDLLVIRTRQVIEFLVILLGIYLVSVLIGDALIDIWHNGFLGFNSPLIHWIAIAFFVVWFGLSNTFFHIAVLVFFDRLVKAIGARKKVVDGQLEPNIVN
jgi:hypothetical protein